MADKEAAAQNWLATVEVGFDGDSLIDWPHIFTIMGEHLEGRDAAYRIEEDKNVLGVLLAIEAATDRQASERGMELVIAALRQSGVEWLTINTDAKSLEEISPDAKILPFPGKSRTWR